MFGRRNHLRFTINPAVDGALRILNDVVVQESGDELIAISREPGVVGETLGVRVIGGHGAMHTVARIVESRPLIANGVVRHRLRLERVEPCPSEN
jgi:hypothetical protein